jgi:hypothetical protein
MSHEAEQMGKSEERQTDGQTTLRSYQFRLAHLLLLPLLLVLFFTVSAVGGFGLGAFVAVFVIAIVLTLFPRWKSLGSIIFFVLMTCAMVWPAITISLGGGGAGTECRRNLKRIGQALQQYHDQFGCFPPACVSDAQGHPMHSWRVLILPFLGRQDVYQRYHFDEPWNGPHNRRLAKTVIEAYNCPDDPDSPCTTTNYLAVVGERTIWPGETPQQTPWVPDGSSNTIFLVESTESGIHWMEPRDLRFDEMPMQINGPPVGGISGNHPRASQYPRQKPTCTVVLMADGACRTLANDLAVETLRALLIVDDGEPVTNDW